MHRASESIGAIAAALAKAQGELTNPEKSLTATIATPGVRGGDRSFRYAPLSSGLDIVRKTLGRHEIAAVQTTAIDTAAGLVRLNTVLAHSSGEWISSEWPVCRVSETVTPQRMGAALTYARRYALFTLVGIAGEDDLDAPDAGPAPSLQDDLGTDPAPKMPGEANSLVSVREPQFENGAHRRPLPRRTASVLTPPESAATRSILIGELSGIASAEQLTEWAHQKLPIKNTLTIDDARTIEEAFQARVKEILGSQTIAADATPTNANQSLSDDPGPPKELGPPAPQRRGLRNHNPRRGSGQSRKGDGFGTGVDKSVLTISEPRRLRNKEHLKYVASQACLICGREPSDPHHLGFAQPRALGRKVSDEYVVPLCRSHHRELHRSGKETNWWNQYHIEPLKVASALWTRTRLPEQSQSLDPIEKPQPDTLAPDIRGTIARRHSESRNEANSHAGHSMTSFRQIEANRRNARKSTGPMTEEGKQRSRCNAVRHGLTAETVIGALEDAEDYKAFEAAIIADYDAQSAVERELVLRLASLLWRLRRASTMETGLFEIQAEQLRAFRQSRDAQPSTRALIYAISDRTDGTEPLPSSGPKSFDPASAFARCFLRLANLPSYPLDRLSRYEAVLWRQAGQILFALEALDRRKPQERGRRFRISPRREPCPDDREGY